MTEEVMTLNIPAPVQPRINQVPQPILSQPVIKSEPTINMSETTLVRDPELVSVVNKLKTGKIETEIGYPQGGFNHFTRYILCCQLPLSVLISITNVKVSKVQKSTKTLKCS